jgi:hypothetical protein
MTDDVMEGRISESMFRRALVWLVGSRFGACSLHNCFWCPRPVSLSLSRRDYSLARNALGTIW